MNRGRFGFAVQYENGTIIIMACHAHSQWCWATVPDVLTFVKQFENEQQSLYLIIVLYYSTIKQDNTRAI